MAKRKKVAAFNFLESSSRILLYFALILIIQIYSTPAIAQTCSCGGPPLLGSLESLPGTAGNLQIGMTYDYRSISDLVSFSKELDDDIRDRTSSTALFQADYSLTDRMTLSFSLPFVRQSRTIQSQLGTGEELQTRGFGDVMVLTKYSLIPSSIFTSQSVAVGFGLKFPTGTSELRNNGLLISADMQTGTGSIDYVLWGATSRVISRDLSLNIFASTLYRINGTNDRFGIGSDSYKFGNEFRVVTGGSIQIIPNLIQSLSVKYRNSIADKFADLSLPSSGGQWVDIETGFSSNLLNNIGLNVTGLIPIYRRVEQTQFSTSFAVSFSFFYNLNLKGIGDGLI